MNRLEVRCIQSDAREGCNVHIVGKNVSFRLLLRRSDHYGVWNVAVEAGERVEAGQKLLVLEAMKMEIAVAAPAAGIVVQLNCAAGALVSPGQHLVMLRHEVGV